MDISPNFIMLSAFSALIVAVLVNSGFGLVVLSRTYRKAYGWYFALTMLGIVLWALAEIVMLFSRNAAQVQGAAFVFYIAPMLIPMGIWYFALSFPENRKIGLFPVLSSLTYFGILSLLFTLKFDFFIKDIQITSTLNIAAPQLPGFLLYAAFFSLFFIFTYITFWQKMRRFKGLSRAQVSYTFFGALMASIPALFTNLTLPMAGHLDVIWLGPLFTLVFAFAVTVAIVRHHLFDIRLYAVRSAAYLLTLFVVAILYVVPATFLSTYFLKIDLELSSIVFLASITLIVAFLFNPVKRFFDRITKQFFYQDAYDPQHFFNEFNQALVVNVKLDALLLSATSIIATTLKAEHCLVVLRPQDIKKMRVIGTSEKIFGEQDILKINHAASKIKDSLIIADYLAPTEDNLRGLLARSNIAVLAQLRTGSTKEDFGYVVLGPKKSGNPYNDQDIRALGTVANELVIAIQNALRFEEIERFNATLQEKVEEATTKLRAINKKLLGLDQTKDDFISMASHQLRTPLTSVKGYVSMVLDGDAGSITPLQRKLLNQSFISAQRMVYLISDLLNVSRLRTGKFIIESNDTNLANVIQEEVDQLGETAKSRDLTLEYHKPEHFPILMLDETKMRQVIMNFIDNAIYYTPSGGHITINLVEKPKTIELTVVDDGIGVPRHEQHHLFSKFFRANNAKRARPDGTGLGLFMAKKVIVAQGGALIFKSHEGQGSTFGFTFAKEKLGLTSIKEGNSD